MALEEPWEPLRTFLDNTASSCVDQGSLSTSSCNVVVTCNFVFFAVVPGSIHKTIFTRPCHAIGGDGRASVPMANVHLEHYNITWPSNQGCNPINGSIHLINIIIRLITYIFPLIEYVIWLIITLFGYKS